MNLPKCEVPRGSLRDQLLYKSRSSAHTQDSQVPVICSVPVNAATIQADEFALELTFPGSVASFLKQANGQQTIQSLVQPMTRSNDASMQYVPNTESIG